MSVRAAAARLAALARGAGPVWAASLVLDRVLPIGVLGFWPDWRIAEPTLARQVEAILAAWGMSAEHVAVVLEHLLYADRHGIDSHGCSMLLHYDRARREGVLAMNPVLSVVRDGPTCALLDGGGGLGHLAGDRAMKLAIEKCRDAGLAAVAVRNSSHFGAAGAYAEMAARAGLIGIATTTTRTPAVVPTFGVEAMLGTNPIAFAAPAARNPAFLLDMATSTAPVGRLTTAWRKGRAIPEGWALDPQGLPVTSARRAARYRRLTPLGSTPEMSSHKGYGLAAAVEILSSILTGARAAASGEGVGHFFLALDPGRFRAADEFATDLDALLDGLRASCPVDPHQPVLVAGDPERAASAERAQAGIPLARAVVEDLRALCRESGVPFLIGERA